jgi:tetratricopeptide (TPR) repeat protein
MKSSLFSSVVISISTVLLLLFTCLWVLRWELYAMVSIFSGAIRLRRKRLPEAETCFRTAIARLGGERRGFTVTILARLASVCMQQGKLEEAEAALSQGLRLVRAIPFAASGLREMRLLVMFAHVSSRRRDWKGLEQIGHELFALGGGQRRWLPVRINAGRYLGIAAMHRGQYERAIPLLREAYDWLPPRREAMVLLMNTSINLALCQMRSGRYTDALATNEGALRRLAAGIEGGADLRASILNNMGVVLSILCRHEEAVAHYQEALRICNQTEQASYAIRLNNLANSRLALKQYEQSEADIRRAIGLLELEPQSLSTAIGTFAMLCVELGREQGAGELDRRAISLEYLLDPIEIALNLEGRAVHFRSLGQLQDAAPLFARAAALRAEIGADPAPAGFRA